MKTLWAGIRESEVLCYHNRGSEMVRLMRCGQRVPIAPGFEVGPITRDGALLGFGLVVVQTSDPAMVMNPETHEQYLWLAENWLLSQGIGPEEAIRLHTDDADEVAYVPEKWR